MYTEELIESYASAYHPLGYLKQQEVLVSSSGHFVPQLL